MKLAIPIVAVLPDPFIYSICYVNGFQTQPGDEVHPEVLRDEAGEPLVDPNWPDENIIDISTAAMRADAATFLYRTIDRCADAGYKAVEFDNLDSYTRSDGQLTLDDAVAFAGLLVEECDQFEECGTFTGVYGARVIDIEYTDDLRRPFAEVCADASTPRITILRDRALSPAGSPDYVYEHC